MPHRLSADTETLKLGLILILSLSLLSPCLARAAEVTLAWDANSPVPDGYRVFCRQEGQAYDYSQPCWAGNVNTATIGGLENNTAYFFVVRAFDGSLESADSQEVMFANGTLYAIQMEAEDGDLQWPMTIADDAGASAGGYVAVAEGSLPIGTPVNNAGSVNYYFTVPEAGNYTIWVRQGTSVTSADSFYVSMDGQAEMVWFANTGTRNTWSWDVISDRTEQEPRDTTNPYLYNLTTGWHALTIRPREVGVKIDTIIVTDDPDITGSGLCITLAADVNRDYVVNFGDLGQLRATFGQSGTPGWIPSDVNIDGSVNFADLGIIRSQFGQIGCPSP